jgi:hypothetical protein
LLSTAAVAGPTAAAAAAANGSVAQAELEFLLAERHLAAALLKHLAAVVAADAATAAAVEPHTAGEPHRWTCTQLLLCIQPPRSC